MAAKRLWLVAILALVAGLAAWRLTPKAAPPSAPVGPMAASSAQPAPARRVVTLSPALSEVAFAIGGGDRVVGVADFTNWPPEAAKLPRLGAFINPNLELMATLKPDLVVVQGNHDKVREYCQSHGQAFASYAMDTVEDVFKAALDLGRRLGCQTRAENEVARLRGELDGLRAALKDQPRVKTYLSVGRAEGRVSALSTCNQRTFLHELLVAAGGDNVFADALDLYPQPSLEALIVRAPEAIIDLQPGAGMGVEAAKAKRSDWDSLASLPAVKKQNITILTEDYILIPGPRLAQTALLLAKALHPGLEYKLTEAPGR